MAARTSPRPVVRELVAPPRNARRSRLVDGSEIATYTLADALGDPTCWRPAVLRASGAPAVVRRTPATRPAARRPRTSASRSSTRAGPSSESDEPEPGEARQSSARARLSGFALLHALTPDLSGAARLRLFHRLPRRLQDACWHELARRIDAKADRR